MGQYNSIKAKHPDALLLFRIGDLYVIGQTSDLNNTKVEYKPDEVLAVFETNGAEKVYNQLTKNYKSKYYNESITKIIDISISKGDLNKAMDIINNYTWSGNDTFDSETEYLLKIKKIHVLFYSKKYDELKVYADEILKDNNKNNKYYNDVLKIISDVLLLKNNIDELNKYSEAMFKLYQNKRIESIEILSSISKKQKKSDKINFELAYLYFLQNDLNIAFLFLGAVGILIYCQLLTKNQILIFFLIPMACAYSHAYIIKYYNKNYLVYFILIIFIFTTGKYHLRFNHDRKFIELSGANFDLAKKASLFDKRLKGLKWITPSYSNNPAEEIALLLETKNILEKKVDEKIIITDYQIFSSLLNNKFSSPNKWYDDLSVPNKKSKY